MPLRHRLAGQGTTDQVAAVVVEDVDEAVEVIKKDRRGVAEDVFNGRAHVVEMGVGTVMNRQTTSADLAASSRKRASLLARFSSAM